jgi:hypothetical protein
MAKSVSVCVGCQSRAERHPYVGVGRADLDGNTGEMVSHPVCAPCWSDPSHRKRPLKLAFFPVTAAPIAVAAARVMDAKSKAGEDLALG